MKLKNTFKVSAIFNRKLLDRFLTKEIILLVFLAAAIFFSPRFNFGFIAGGRKLDIRIEDIFLALFGTIWLIKFLPRKKEKPPLFWPISIWVVFGILTSLANLLLGNLDLIRAFLYNLKEIEYFFIYFFVFYNIKRIENVFRMINVWFLFGLVNLFWFLLQVVGRIPLGEYRRGVHYLSAIGEEGIFPVSGTFLVLFIFLASFFLFNYSSFSRKQKIFYSLAVSGFAFSIIALMRRGCVLALAISALIMLLLYLWKMKKLKGRIKDLLPAISSLAVITLILVAILFVARVSIRTEFVSSDVIGWEANERWEIWQEKWDKIVSSHFLCFVFGFGKSIFDESHNQYVRNFVETGLVGSLLFFFLIFSILKITIKNFITRKDSLCIGLSMGIMVSTIALLIVSVPADAFIVVRINEVYWFLMAITIFSLGISKNKDSLNGNSAD